MTTDCFHHQVRALERCVLMTTDDQ